MRPPQPAKLEPKPVWEGTQYSTVAVTFAFAFSLNRGHPLLIRQPAVPSPAPHLPKGTEMGQGGCSLAPASALAAGSQVASELSFPLEWVVMPSSSGSSPPKDQTHVSCVSCIKDTFFTH